MSTIKEEIVKTVAPETQAPEPTSLIALSPQEMRQSQQQLTKWLELKIKSITPEIKDLKDGIEICRKNKCRMSNLKRALAAAVRRREFYRKISIAVQRGFLLIPDLPIEVFAVRTKRKSPHGRSYHSVEDLGHQQRAVALPAEKGRYVDPFPLCQSYSTTENGKEQSYWYGTDFQEVQFPLAMAKPLLLDRATEVMALKLFDEIGLVEAQRDPILVGKIIAPWQYGRRLSFFIAWWFDFKQL